MESIYKAVVLLLHSAFPTSRWTVICIKRSPTLNVFTYGHSCAFSFFTVTPDGLVRPNFRSTKSLCVYLALDCHTVSICAGYREEQHFMLVYTSENYGLPLRVFSEKCTISPLNMCNGTKIS